MDIIIILIGIVIIILLLIIMFRLWSVSDTESDPQETAKAVRESLSEANRELRIEMNGSIQTFSRLLTDNQKQASEAQHRQIAGMDEKLSQNLAVMSRSVSEKQEQAGKAVNDSLINLENRFKSLESSNNEKLENMRLAMTRQLTAIQDENQKKLDVIQNTVNEKLESQLQKSFKLVSERLEKVYESLGEMQSIASGVGDLKKVLSNVKTRGILGEIQLGSILEEILAPELYDREVPTIPDSKNRVEYAVKLPGAPDGSSIYLPIDSKFPGDTYAALQDAYDSGDKERIEAAKKTLEGAVKKCAADISSKYVAPPYTTNFGIMFLPFEGLYAEAVKLGLVETLQRDYSVSIAGPSTMAAMLNSLQMGFRTLAIQKRSSEVWEILGSVKKEFGSFSEALEKTQKHIRQVDDDLEKLIGTRTRQINRSLSKVELPELEESSPE